MAAAPRSRCGVSSLRSPSSVAEPSRSGCSRDSSAPPCWLGAVGTSAQAQGVSGYTEVTGTAVTVPGFTSATGSATCPAGDVVLSGGYTLAGGNMVIDTSAPLGANGAISSTTWTVTGFDNGDGQGSFTPYAICVSSSIAGYSEASKAQSVNASSSAQLTETCPAGSVITGGGFSRRAALRL